MLQYDYLCSADNISLQVAIWIVVLVFALEYCNVLCPLISVNNFYKYTENCELFKAVNNFYKYAEICEFFTAVIIKCT